ncbi:MAG TPA: NAD(+)/NADH kinase [Actinomycetota bacterium]|nr:NAD(+)/NADH kinase [Actinomycetota bacterium]
MRVGFVVHPARERAVEAAGKLVAWCRERGLVTRSLAEADVGADESLAPGSFVADLALVVSVGGDGTLLRAARLADLAEAPILGVNVGRLGFLTECEPDDAPEVLEAFLADRHVFDERTALVAEVEGADAAEPEWALNEVVVEKRSPRRMVTLATAVGDSEITTFSADGVIVATATGSTAYSFAARGPIVSPSLACLIITPVAPHMVFDRALVLGPDEQVRLEVRGSEPGLLSADGRPERELPVGARVTIRRAERSARLVRRAGAESFYSLLRRKFSLPAGSPGRS